jgi:hypothetical protein
LESEKTIEFSLHSIDKHCVDQGRIVAAVRIQALERSGYLLELNAGISRRPAAHPQVRNPTEAEIGHFWLVGCQRDSKWFIRAI